jgi:ubiquinone/menaquinone biosynthesis C-methylase UbiE
MKKVFCGSEMDRMPNWAFRAMSFIFNVTDFFISPDNKLTPFEIKKGNTIIDYGCGTGRYLKKASELVGDGGVVYAVDIHELSIKSALQIIEKFNLKNIKPILTDGKSVNVPEHSADIIYALDMFHMVKDPRRFLTELNRLIRPDGILYLEDGHQPRAATREKILNSDCWDIMETTKKYVQCKPKNQ